MSKLLNLEVTENMQYTIDDMPDNVAEMFLASLLDMACLMVQAGDITVHIVDDKKFKVTAHAKSGIRTLTVDLVSAS